ncbi:YT521-B-like domain-containing protein [Lophiotrema nucula]|uniref:YT521-B-like domain-containing protein n=1 Tax=Lophiotrema nucula TaxID=690887 RepID=A0A6A5YSJ7_9PLEO|nr:YT521-B-like domain-containing protein [Lophiotrema nucula]
MAFVWVQQWIALPVVYEEQMGDLPPGSVPQPLDITAAGLAHDEHQLNNPSSSSLRSPSSNAPFYSQLSSISQGQGRPDPRSPAHATSPHYLGQEHATTSLNLGAMAGALPDYGPTDIPGNAQAQQQGQRPLSGASTSALVYQLGQNLQMPGHGSSTHPPYVATSYGPNQFQQNFVPPQGTQHPPYGPFSSSHQRLTGPSSMQHQYQNYPQPSQYLYYPSPYGPPSQFSQGFSAQAAQSQSQALYGRRPSLPSSQMPIMGQNMDMAQHESGYSPIGRHFGNAQADGGPMGSISTGGFLPQGVTPRGPSSLIPRGPPRKPKQSGHALWVGNLPPGTTVLQLKDHFSRDATRDIESLFLISKSNCAFVNYRTEASCTAAMHRFHDSRFNGVRLVCRLRRSSAPASGVPTGPSAMLGSQPASTSPPKSPQLAEGDEAPADEVESLPRLSGEESRPISNAAVKYFIVKSLTLQDLELSVRNGIWATQSHNEHVLNKAFQSAEHVYLIFSANKSGEYFGYARMASPILEDAAHLIGAAPQPENILESPDVPKSIPTAATEWAPKGRIIDDSARGTIFWEAQLSESETEEGDIDKQETPDIVEGDASVAQSWGKPFKIEWISTNRLPFYRTRGLRNPWNANREVKIARDGTELETSVGERLIQMFHRLGPSSAGAPMMQPPPLGASQMRPY